MDKEERRGDMIEKGIPVYTAETLVNWIHHAISPGSFVRAIICNDLVGAFAHADDTNSRHIGDIVSYMYNHAPMACWRSKENYMSWEGLDNES